MLTRPTHQGFSRFSRAHRFAPWLIASLLSVSGAAQADDAETPVSRPAEDKESTGKKSTAKVELDTVTVTARRRTEKAQDVPAPISVLSGRQLDEQHVYQVQDLQQLLPNVTAQFLHARQSSLSVRGIGNNTANEGLESSVGIYLDNVFLGRPGQAVFDLLDIEQLELLRGPQGTLFGKNTTAGVLNISTRQPSFEREAGAEISYGSRNYQQYKGYVSAPLSDTVAFRLSAYGTHDDGFIRNVVDGKQLNEINRQGVRGQILVKPDSDFSLRLIGEYNQENSSTGTLVPYSYGPLTRSLALSGAVGAPAYNTANSYTNYAAWASLLGAKKQISDPYLYQVSNNSPQSVNVHQSAVSAEANWMLAGGYKLTSVSAWRDWYFTPQNDLDLTTLYGQTGGFSSKEDQFSQEIRLASPVGGVYDYVVGGYFYHQNSSSNNRYDTGPLAFILSGGANPNNNILSGTGEAKTDSFAVFGQNTWHVTPRFDLTAGLRYTLEKKSGHVIQNALGTPNATIPGTTYPWSVYPIFASWDSGELQRTDNSVSGLLTPSYRFSSQVLSYATYSHGEKSGGFNVNSIASAGAAFGAAAISLQPEKVDNVELGLKTSWWDNRLQLNGNFFYTMVKDYQAVTTRFYAPTGGFLQVLTNVGDLTSKGFEFDAKAQPTNNLALNFNGAYTHAKFDNGSGPTPAEVYATTGGGSGYGRGAESIAGNWVNGAPKWTFNLGGQYRLYYTGSVEQYVNTNYAWRSETYGDINNSSYSRIPSYGLVNLATGWRIRDGYSGRWDLSFWIRNAFDKHYFLGLSNYGNNFYVASVGQPRTIGASLRYDFF